MLKKRNPFLMILIGLIIYLTNAGYSFGYISANGAGNGYCEPGDPSCSGPTSFPNSRIKINSVTLIESYIEEGGSYFLKAFSDILLLSSRVEASKLGGFDENEIQKTIESGLVNIQNAKSIYYLLIREAESTPYNPVVISQLKTFPYSDFMIKNSLNNSVFKEVQDYLQNGNITGIFKRFNSKLLKMEELVMSIKTENDSTAMISIPVIWKLNETASDNLLFGQYVARIFSELIK